MSRLILPLVLLLCMAMAACQGGPPTAYAPEGDVLPTVAGRAPMTFPSAEAARCAYSRACGSLTAVEGIGSSTFSLRGP